MKPNVGSLLEYNVGSMVIANVVSLLENDVGSMVIANVVSLLENDVGSSVRNRVKHLGGSFYLKFSGGSL